MAATPPPPPAKDLISSVFSSTEELTAASDIKINSEAMDKFVAGLNQGAGGEDNVNGKAIRLPLRFDTKEEEVNVLCLLFLLSSLSPYSPLLRRQTTRGPFSSTLLLILSSFLSHPSSSSDKPLSTSYLLSLSPASLAEMLQLKTHTEKDHPTLGSAVKVGEKDEEVWKFLESVTAVAKETGAVLKGSGKSSLGEWMVQTLKETKGEGEEIVVRLVTTFPAFNDAFTIDSKPVYFYRKAFALLSAISSRFSAPNLTPEDLETPLDFPLPTFQAPLPVGADNLISSALIDLDVLQASTPVSSPLPSSSAVVFRAASLTACATILKVAPELTGEALEIILRVKGKELEKDDVNKVWREDDTIFY